MIEYSLSHLTTGARRRLLLCTLLLPAAQGVQAWQIQRAPVMTPWAALVDTNSPLPEYPRPQMVRANWLSLNGIWEFQAGSVGDPVPTHQVLSEEILVPYPMESALSGVQQHHARSWYRRTFTVPVGWAGQRILLHLGAVDWESEVFVNGQSMGIHRGGYDPIEYDITPYLAGSGPQELIVRVWDPTDTYGQARGKQTLNPGGIMYTSCSGIWQSVWLEPVPATRILDIALVPDIDQEVLLITVKMDGPTDGISVRAVALAGRNPVGSVTGAPGVELSIPVPAPTLWSPGNPFLYDLDIELRDGATEVDAVTSYFGMRKVSLGMADGFMKMLLNDAFVFEFGPLDQGFWPDGIYTAPTDDALKSDIEQTKLLGFNMIRKHIKVEPARWYYWADHLGMLVWQDMPSVNSYTGNPQPIDGPQFETELSRMVRTHWNHPSIISWVVFNESQGQHDTESLVATVHALDPSRLVNQASGGTHVGAGDILDVHSYPNPSYPVSASQAVVCGEFGGVGLGITNHTWAPGWGYISAADGDDLADKFEGFCYQLSDFVSNHGLSGAIYTEITDVEIELNGLLTYDRAVRKSDADRIRAAIALAGTPIVLTPVAPTSRTDAQTWQYTTSTPVSGWETAGFNDAGWSTGQAGFGAGDPPNTAGLIRTPWNTDDIWLRRTFNPGALTAPQVSNLFFSVYYDEDVEIYLNGVLAASRTGYTTSYGLVASTDEGRAALAPDATNVMAVHCHQTGGGQYIDAGISLLAEGASVPPRPAPAAPSGLQAAADIAGVSLGWSTSANATGYPVKRAAVSGGPYTNLVAIAANNAFIDTTVDPGVTYYYVVAAANASGVSGDSTEVAVTTVVPPAPGLVAWFSADQLIGLDGGESVAVWPDSSGQGNDADQTDNAARPTYAPAAINGLPAVHFDADTGSFLTFPRPIQDDFTILCVFQSSQGRSLSENFYSGAGLVSGEVANPVDDFAVSLNLNGKLLAGTGNPDVTIASSGGFNNGQPHLVSLVRTRATGALELYVDGSAEGTESGGNQSLTAPARLAIGAQQTVERFLTGDIAEIRLFDAALSPAFRGAEEDALFCKYGIGSGAPPAVPAALTANAADGQVALDWMPSPGASGYALQWALDTQGPYAILGDPLADTTYLDGRATLGKTNYYRVAATNSCGSSANSSTVAVLPPLPVLQVAGIGSALTVDWPEWAVGWEMWSTTNLSIPTAWVPVTNALSNGDGLLVVRLDADVPHQYFRLSAPEP